MNVDHIRTTEVLTLDRDGQFGVKTTQDGYLTAYPRIGRIGIQLYKGSELGRPEMEVVRVWRPEAEVMHKDAARTATHRPVTNDHPREAVTADNWKKYSVGQTGEEVMRDGEFIRVPMCLMDAGVIRDYNDGKKELSLGYTSNIEWRSGVNDQQEAYDAVQTTIRINHLAVVDAARGGPKLAIGDHTTYHPLSVADAKKLVAAGKVEREKPVPVGFADGVKVQCLDTEGKYVYAFDNTVYRSALMSIKAEAGTNQHPAIVRDADELLTLIDKTRKTKMNDVTARPMRTEVFDGIAVELSDIAASVVLRRVKGLEQEAGDLRTKLEASEKKHKDAADKEAEEEPKRKKKTDEDAATIATLTKQLADAQITPAKLDQMVRDRHVVIGKAKTILGDKLIVDGKTEGDIRKQVVSHAMGGDEAIKGWSDDAVAASFATLTKDAKPEAILAADAARATFSGAPNSAVVDKDKLYQSYDTKTSENWKSGGQTATKQ
jgi:hypothetical protein